MEKPVMPTILRVSPGFLVVDSLKAKRPPRAVYFTRDKADDLASRFAALSVKECWLLVLDDGRVLVLSETPLLVPEIDLVEDERRRQAEAWEAAAEKLTAEERVLLGVVPPDHLRSDLENVEEEPDPEDDAFEIPVGKKPLGMHRDRKPARGNS